MIFISFPLIRADSFLKGDSFLISDFSFWTRGLTRFFVEIRILPQRLNEMAFHGVQGKARILRSPPLVLLPAALPASPCLSGSSAPWISRTVLLPTTELGDAWFPLPGTFFWATFLHQRHEPTFVSDEMSLPQGICSDHLIHSSSLCLS